MVFSSLTFLVFFLPIFLLVYFVVPKKNVNARNFVLLVFSLFFYAAGEPVWVVILLFSASTDCLIGLFMERFLGRWQAKVLLVLSLCCSLGVPGAVISLVCGFLALDQIKKDPQRYSGKGLAYAGIGMSIIAIVVGIVVLVFPFAAVFL